MIGTRLYRVILAVALYVLASGAALAEARLENFRLGVDGNRTRIVIDLTEKVAFKYFTLADPYRVVIDLPALTWQQNMRVPAWEGLVKNLRFGLFSTDIMRVVLDANGPVSVSKIFLLEPSAGFNYRLVIDLETTSETAFRAAIDARRAVESTASEPEIAPSAPIRSAAKPKNSKPVIVIDAGHGGVDPGAHGRKAREKDVVLAFARELAAALRKSGRYEVHLTRDRDIYIPLRERVNIARRHDANLFISIHADAIERKKVRGMSIYTLSETASDKEAAALARQENRSDIIAGIDFGNQPSEVTNILIDLAQRETKNLSVKFANTVVSKMDGKTKLLDRTHRFAGFRVLKAPDVPSVLIELGFLTNPNEEKLLVSSKWRKSVSAALTEAVDKYFASLAGNS
jgi:N-acetylmuramoyl-L-alanine amidase